MTHYLNNNEIVVKEFTSASNHGSFGVLLDNHLYVNYSEDVIMIETVLSHQGIKCVLYSEGVSEYRKKYINHSNQYLSESIQVIVYPSVKLNNKGRILRRILNNVHNRDFARAIVCLYLLGIDLKVSDLIQYHDQTKILIPLVLNDVSSEHIEISKDLILKVIPEFQNWLPISNLRGIQNSRFDTKSIKLRYIKLMQKYEQEEIESPRGSPVIYQNSFSTFDQSYVGNMTKKYGKYQSSQGFTPKEVFDAMFKYIRLGNEVQAIACAFELQRFMLIGATDMVSELYDRLNMYVFQEVSMADLGFASYISGWNTLFTKEGNLDWLDLPSSMIESVLLSEQRYSNARLAAVVQLITKKKKTDIVQQSLCCYTNPKARLKMINLGYQVEEYSLHKIYNRKDYLDWKNESVPYLDSSDYDYDEGLMALCAIIIHNRLAKRDYNAIGWLNYYLNNFVYRTPTIKVAKRFGRSRCDVILWSILNCYISRQILRPIMAFYYSLKSKSKIIPRSEHIKIFISLFLRIIIGDHSIEDQLIKTVLISDEQTLKWNAIDTLPMFVEGEIDLEIEHYNLKTSRPMIHQNKKILTMNNLDQHFSNEDFKTIYLQN